MKRVPVKDTILVWCNPQNSAEKQLDSTHFNKENNSGEKEPKEKRQTPEQMIRSLQGVFCTGRYRSFTTWESLALAGREEKNA